MYNDRVFDVVYSKNVCRVLCKSRNIDLPISRADYFRSLGRHIHGHTVQSTPARPYTNTTAGRKACVRSRNTIKKSARCEKNRHNFVCGLFYFPVPIMPQQPILYSKTENLLFRLPLCDFFLIFIG